MEKAYTPQLHDQKWQDFWAKEDIAKPEVSIKKHKKPSGKTFTIVMPPPNVTGVLHQGHALTLSLEDTLIRWRRMKGDETLYLPGTDHASIAVQMLVAKNLTSQGIDYKNLGREKFLEETWRWIKEYQPRIYEQIKVMGASCDWSRVKFTMDDELNKAVTYSFVELYKKGLIYRAEKLVNWTPKGQTGVSDLEVIYEEREGSLWHIRYPLEDSNEFLVVATTRPETMLGDSAVTVHPNDDRYKKFVGKMVKLPLVDRLIPVVADEMVDMNFGTGVVKVTPAHDNNDFECGLRHNLARIVVLSKEGKVVSGLPNKGATYGGMDRFEARKKIVEDLENAGLIEKIEKHKNRVGISERFGDVIEPYLSHQWFVKIKPMADRALMAVQKDELKIIPQEFRNQYIRWMENIHDWCISRQLWWGQAIPAYHCVKCSHIEVAQSPVKICPKCKSDMQEDPDVLDTWFSSGLWPFSTLGWPDKNASDFKKFYPTQVMETGFDILFFWVARMVMMGLEFTDKLPFDRVYLHPMVRDQHGQKMSKTKGNVTDPLEIVKEFGADTLRFSLNALCVQGRDLALSNDRIDGYRNFINKVWNATKFVLMGLTEGVEVRWTTRPKAKHLHDRWILGQLDKAARDLDSAWNEFRMQEAADIIYHFIWNDFCDWYLEAAKCTRADSQSILMHVLGESLKMLHPICPHITEELFHELPGVKATDSLAVECFPEGAAFPDADAIAEFNFVKESVGALRALRSESGVKPNKKINIYLNPDAASATAKVLKSNSEIVAALIKSEPLHFEEFKNGKSTKVVLPSLEAGKVVEFFIPMSDLVDLEEEKQRLKKEVESLEKIVKSQESKLSNESFVKNAPPEVVDKEKLKLKEAQEKLLKTKDSLVQLGN